MIQARTTDRVTVARARLLAPLEKQLDQLCDILTGRLEALEANETERRALALLESGEYNTAKLVCLTGVDSPYLAAVSCIASAKRSPVVADSILREAARHVAECCKRAAEREIAEAFAAVLKEALS